MVCPCERDEMCIRDRMYAGETGYYWSSSVSPIFPNSMYNAWAQESRRDLVGNVSTSISAGHLIRCFRDN